MTEMTWKKMGWWNGADFGLPEGKKYKCPRVAILGDAIIGRSYFTYNLRSFEADGQRITFRTTGTHGLTVGQLVKISGLTAEVSKVFAVDTVPDTNTFTVLSDYDGEIKTLFTFTPCAVRMGYRNCGFPALASARFVQDGEARMPFELYMTAASPSSRTADMLERIDYELIPYSPEVVIFMGGANESNAEQIMANVRAIHKKLMDNQIDMWLCSPAPVTSSYSNAAAKNEFIRGLNQNLKNFATEVGIPFIDMYSALADEDGMGIEDYYNDTMHPGDLGHHVMAGVLLEFMQETVEGRNTLPVRKDESNIYPDPMFDSTTTTQVAGVTGVRPVNSSYISTSFSGISSITHHFEKIKNWESNLYWTPESTNTMVRLTASSINISVDRDCFVHSEYFADFETFEERKARIAFSVTFIVNRAGTAHTYTDYSITNGQVPGDGKYYVLNTPGFLRKGDILTTINLSAQLIAMDGSGTCRLKLRQCRIWLEDSPTWLA